jgi:hypothetical protein
MPNSRILGALLVRIWHTNPSQSIPKFPIALEMAPVGYLPIYHLTPLLHTWEFMNALACFLLFLFFVSTIKMNGILSTKSTDLP